MKKYDVNQFINSIEKKPNVEKLDKIKVRKNCFVYNGKKYPYSNFSDWDIQKYDKKILKNKKLRIKKTLLRTLKHACSLDLVNPRIVVANSIIDTFTCFIIYQEHDKEKVIDYGKDLVMDKDDYYELFEVNEFNQVNKKELGIINFFTENCKEDILEYLLFTKEKFKDLTVENPWINEKYDKFGRNNGNRILYGHKFDALFFQKNDYNDTKYDKIRSDIANFTLNPKRWNIYIKKIKDSDNKEKYLYKNKKESLIFTLLSDGISNEEIKNILLTNDRYCECHRVVYKTASMLLNSGFDKVYITSGKNKLNDKDYFYHSWVEYEVDNEIFVIDYTNNLVVDKDTYYKLYETCVINRTPADKMKEIVSVVGGVFDFVIPPYMLNYFGQEMMNDIKKNEKVLIRK